jgi:hypothetical protein
MVRTDTTVSSPPTPCRGNIDGPRPIGRGGASLDSLYRSRFCLEQSWRRRWVQADRAAAEPAEARMLLGGEAFSSIAAMRAMRGARYWGVEKIRAL